MARPNIQKRGDIRRVLVKMKTYSFQSSTARPWPRFLTMTFWLSRQPSSTTKSRGIVSDNDTLPARVSLRMFFSEFLRSILFPKPCLNTIQI